MSSDGYKQRTIDSVMLHSETSTIAGGLGLSGNENFLLLP